MKVTFLGTGTSQGVPVIGSDHPVCRSKDKKDHRLRVSALIELNGFNYLIDCGPDFRQQMLRSKCERIDSILYTHEHSDHVMGLDDIRPFYYKQGDIPIYAHKRVLKSLKKKFDYIFKTGPKYPGAPTVTPHVIKNKSFKINNQEIIPINVKHMDLQVFGYRLNDFAYITDMKTIKERETEKLNNLKVLVINALRIEPHYSHLNLDEALRFIERIKPERTYLTHISNNLGFHAEVEKSLPRNVFLAYDNLKINI